MKHFIDIDQLSVEDVVTIFAKAEQFITSPYSICLKDRKLINLFFENSTRTRSSFEIAALNLGADVINIDVSTSSLQKGESDQDTVLTLNAMLADFITIRHGDSGMVQKLSEYSDASIINSGDGSYAHPTQALLDCFTIYKVKGFRDIAEFKKLTVTICGDIINSRVARSNIKLLTKLGSEIRLVGPSTLLPKFMVQDNIELFFDLKNAVRGTDVIYTLRVQRERMKSCSIPSMREYYYLYGVNYDVLNCAKKDCIILHPGPMNRNIEIMSMLADNVKVCKVLDQVRNGVVVRQAVLEFLWNERKRQAFSH